MALIKINGVDLPTPSVFNPGLQDISKAERNARGTLIKELIRGNVRKLELSWNYLSASQLSQVLTAVSPVFFDVTYPDPLTGAERTGTFYAGDRSMGMVSYVNGVPRYDGIKINLVER